MDRDIWASGHREIGKPTAQGGGATRVLSILRRQVGDRDPSPRSGL